MYAKKIKYLIILIPIAFAIWYIWNVLYNLQSWQIFIPWATTMIFFVFWRKAIRIPKKKKLKKLYNYERT